MTVEIFEDLEIVKCFVGFSLCHLQLGGGGDLVRVLLLHVEAGLPGDGQPDPLALVVGGGHAALAGVLLSHDQLGQGEAGLDLLVPALGPRHGHSSQLAVLLYSGGTQLQREVDLE